MFEDFVLFEYCDIHVLLICESESCQQSSEVILLFVLKFIGFVAEFKG